jgi:glycosyltransferase involved in cell wall biosynthesis
MIWFIPLERLEERYTKQMYDWVIDGFQRKGVKFGIIDGLTLTSDVQTGEVLDAEGTNYFKATQLAVMCQMIKEGEIQDGDVFFVADLWFPGIEMLRYIEAQKKMHFSIAGVHYAGVFDPNDFVYKMRSWAQFNEAGWLALADWIFVGSEYHKGLIVKGLKDNFNVNWAGKIYSTGLVWDADYVKSEVKTKERKIVFPHRTDAEKNPIEFFRLAKRIKAIDPKVKFVITSSRKTLSSNIPDFFAPDYVELKIGLTKQQYYDELASSKVLFSSAFQETFGYALNEGLKLGCFPVCPKRLSYPEVVENDERCLYINLNDAVNKVMKALDITVDVSSYTQKYSKNIDNMLEIMGV